MQPKPLAAVIYSVRHLVTANSEQGWCQESVPFNKAPVPCVVINDHAMVNSGSCMGTTVVSPRLNIRFATRMIRSLEGQFGSGQAIRSSVVIQSAGCVILCFAASSGSTDAMYQNSREIWMRSGHSKEEEEEADLESRSKSLGREVSGGARLRG